MGSIFDVNSCRVLQKISKILLFWGYNLYFVEKIPKNWVIH